MAIEQLTLFYDGLDEPTRLFVQGKAQDIQSRLKRTAEDIIAIGQDLLEVKDRLAHGQFLPWLQSEFGMGQASAYRFMQVASRFGDTKLITVINLPAKVLYELSAPSTSDEIIAQVESGEIPATIPAIRAAKSALLDDDPAIERMWLDAIYGPGNAPPAEPQPLDFVIAPGGDELVSDQVWPTVDAHGIVVSKDDIETARELKREQQRERINLLRANGADLPTGIYSCLVVDPPWPMQKIERDVRPNQVEFDYPTMSEEELRAFPLPDVSASDCHLYLWTTQKFLPMALRLAEHWGFKYQCLLTWVKNVGFTPFSWMYSTEHVLFCTRGSLPLLTLGKRLDFSAKVREHSRKPDEFYDLVREASPGPRLDVFSREKRDGFEQYGNEVGKYGNLSER